MPTCTSCYHVNLRVNVGCGLHVAAWVYAVLLFPVHVNHLTVHGALWLSTIMNPDPKGGRACILHEDPAQATMQTTNDNNCIHGWIPVPR
jgi:hypothetical protein